MNYKELFNRYKNGAATEEEKQLVEREIEKYEALEEYLSAVIDEEFGDIVQVPATQKHQETQKYDEETAKLKKSVNKRLRKVMLTSVAIVIALFTGIFFVVSPLIDTLYYNPGKTVVGEVDNDISFDVYAISELNMPGFSPSNVSVEKKGFGQYDVMYLYRNVFNDDFYSVRHKIKRGEITSSYGDPILNPMVNSNMFQSIRHPESEANIAERRQAVLNHLRKLNPISYVSAGIIFEHDLSMEELYHLELKYPDIEFEWAGIRTDTPDKHTKDLIGIELIKSKRGSGLLGDERISNRYPAFFILDWLVSSAGSENADSSAVARAYEHHCVSLLEYVVDREDAVNVLEHGREKGGFYRSALKYVKEQGVKTYGVLIFAEVGDLLEMVDEESIKGVDFNQALVSRKDIN